MKPLLLPCVFMVCCNVPEWYLNHSRVTEVYAQLSEKLSCNIPIFLESNILPIFIEVFPYQVVEILYIFQIHVLFQYMYRKYFLPFCDFFHLSVFRREKGRIILIVNFFHLFTLFCSAFCALRNLWPTLPYAWGFSHNVFLDVLKF